MGNRILNLDDTLKMYVVINSEQQFFRAKGRNGYGESWVDDISKATIYTNLGSARRVVTWFSNAHPKFGIPNIIEFCINSGIVLSENNRVKKAILKKKQEILKYAQQDVERERECIISTKTRLDADYKKKVAKLKILTDELEE